MKTKSKEKKEIKLEKYNPLKELQRIFSISKKKRKRIVHPD